MLGLRLDAELESRVARAARARGVSKSAFVREAITAHIARNDVEDEWLRQLAAIAEADARAEEDAFLDALTDMAFADLADDELAWDAPRP